MRRQSPENTVDGNPYLMVGYTMKSVLDADAVVEDTSSFRRVRSMQYFREPGRENLLKWLQDCEDDAGKSVFTMADGNLGLGYADPRFVKEPSIGTFSGPWADSEAEIEREARGSHAAFFTRISRGSIRPRGL